MKILSLQPYYGGSHKHVMDSLLAESQHSWQLLTLPARKWQWRMRHAAATFAEQLASSELPKAVRQSEAIFCSDMLNLAEFRGLAPTWAARLPAVVYFHENQFAYPARKKYQQKQNAEYGFTNMFAACAADQVWFNSAHNRDSFFAGLEKYLKKQSDCQPWDSFEKVQSKCRIVYPGIYPPPVPNPGERKPGPLRIAWAARWEYDKGPEDFFDALRGLRAAGVEFRLRVLGEQFARIPDVFKQAAETFEGEIEAWGFEPSREKYFEWLQGADVFVSTAKHEFFGISVLEGAAAGAVPILPDRLSYPEIFAGCDNCFYDGTVLGLANKLEEVSQQLTRKDSRNWRELRRKCIDRALSFHWHKQAAEFDCGLQEVLASP
ncbi:MAG: DUF3524 domain-containing protein [Lentisphaeria bacterium]